MVNTGKPSGGCGVCRERRIKCDETKPECLKCIRSGRTCSGYSNGFKLRDQTQKTILKARLGKSTRAKQRRNPQIQREDTQTIDAASSHTQAGESLQRQQSGRARSSSYPGLDDVWTSVAATWSHQRSASAPEDSSQQTFHWSCRRQMAELEVIDPQLWQSITTPLVEQARCYFLSSYVIYSPRGPPEGVFTFIPTLLSADLPGTEHFDDLFSAVAIAAFATRPNAGQAALAATSYYSRGVTTLRKALENKTHVKTDTALASTILLAFYEGLIEERAGIVQCNPHFKGAVALLRMRDQDQFATLHGTEMFDFVMQILMRQYELSVACSEEDICRWSFQANMRPKEERPHLSAMYVASLRLQAGRLCDKVKRDAATVQEAVRILRTAQKFEKMVSQRIKAESCVESPGKTTPAPSSLWDNDNNNDNNNNNNNPREPASEGSDWWTTTLSLNKHAFRLLICHMIADVCAWLDRPNTQGSGDFEEAAREAAAIAKPDIDSIISIIPYLCTWTEGRKRGASSPCGQNDAQSTQGLTHLMVIWPLYLAGDSPFATVAQKEYIQLKLQLMAENLGVRHASAVSKHLKIRAAVVGRTSSDP